MFQLTLAGWKYEELSAKVLRNKKIMPQALSIILGYLVCWSWHAYFKPKYHQIIGRPHGATILDRIMKNEIANPTPPPSHKSWMKPCKSQNAPFSDPCLEGRRYKFPIYFVQTSATGQPGGIRNTQFLPQAAQYYGQLWRQNYDDKLVRVSGIFSRPGSVTSSVLTKF